MRDAGDFVDDSFRTITLSADEGIQAVIGKLTSDPDGPTHVQKYRFDKEKGWTMAKAKAWVEEHEEDDKMVSQAWDEYQAAMEQICQHPSGDAQTSLRGALLQAQIQGARILEQRIETLKQ